MRRQVAELLTLVYLRNSFAAGAKRVLACMRQRTMIALAHSVIIFYVTGHGFKSVTLVPRCILMKTQLWLLIPVTLCVLALHFAIFIRSLILHYLVSLPASGPNADRELIGIIRLLHKLLVFKVVRIVIHIQIFQVV
jgi:hypothetical protein